MTSFVCFIQLNFLLIGPSKGTTWLRSNLITILLSGVLGCPGDLQAGDLYTHCFHGHGNGIVSPVTGKVDPVCWEAKRRGVLFDVGHGRGK